MSDSFSNADGDRFPELEPIDPSELNLGDDDSIPSVEAVIARKPGFGFWKALLWCLLFGVITQLLPALVVVGCFLPLVFAGWIDRDHLDLNPVIQIATLVAPICGAVFSIYILRRIVGRDWRRRIGLRTPNAEHVVLTLIAFPAVQVLIGLIYPFIQSILPEPGAFQEFMSGLSSWPLLLSITAIAVGPAVSEELWCRGFLGWGLSTRYGFPIGIALTSFLFGLIHVNPPQAVMAMLLGLLLHLTYLATRSLWVPILLHFSNNAFSILNDSTTFRVPLQHSLESSIAVEPVWFPVSAGILVLVVGIALYQYRVRINMPRGMSRPSNRVLIPAQPGISLLPRPLHPLLVVAVVLSAGLFGWFWLGISP